MGSHRGSLDRDVAHPVHNGQVQTPSDVDQNADLGVTTGHKTQRYLRLTLVAIVVALFVAVTAESVTSGVIQPSISHYFYTSARGVFVGALIAASVCLLALSGRGRPVIWLDIAAIFAPLIALVPTGLESGVPAEEMPGVRNGVFTYCVMVFVIIIAMAVIRAVKKTPNGGARVVSIVAGCTAGVLALLAFVPPLNEGFPFNFAMPGLNSIHFVATLAFFGFFAAVPLFSPLEVLEPGEKSPSPKQLRIYRWIGWLLVASLAVLIVAFFAPDLFGSFPIVLVGEVAALLLFAIFWWVQTFQRWDEPDQRYLVP